MKGFKIVWGVLLFAALIAVVQLADVPLDSPAVLYQRLPAVARLDRPVTGNSFENLAGGTVADGILAGTLTTPVTQPADDLLEKLRPMTTVFPAAAGGIALTKAALEAGAINATLTKQFRNILTQIQAEPRSALAVEKFRDNFMPVFELAKQCRTWDEFQTILRQADSPDQLKVLTKMATGSPAAAQRLSAVLAVAASDGRATVTGALDHIMRFGPKGLDALAAALDKGVAGLKFTIAHPGFTPGNTPAPTGIQATYQSLRHEYGAVVTAAKYLLITLLAALLVLVVVPGRYLEQLVARPGADIVPGAFHYFLSALAVGIILSGLAYLLSLAASPAIESPTLTATATGEATTTATSAAENPLLSGLVVLISLAIHAVVWFIVRGKLRQVEEDETATVELRLKRLENLDVFLDLPLFTGLALTVVAFILITLNAGMSRHFAYTATVVGILSAVSLRIRYLYPLKERLIQAK
ncbi:MAG: hypothetical protein PCFJNLEI_03199 [Verrucomicrobiae bacterium]|nr:hypothetical protein [Verrucomicrobiae bacterium]